MDERTVYRWQHDHPEFCQALKVGKEASGNRVEKSLYRRVVGYSYDAVKIMGYEGVYTPVAYVEHVPPDTTACIFWLKNRRRDLWRDRFDHNVKPVSDVTKMTYAELEDLIRRANAGSGVPGVDNGTAKPTNGSSVH